MKYNTTYMQRFHVHLNQTSSGAGAAVGISGYLSAAAAAVELSRRRRHLRRTREAAAECCPRWRRVVAIVAAGTLLGSSGLGLFDVGCPRAAARSDDGSGARSAAGGSSHQSECLCDTLIYFYRLEIANKRNGVYLRLSN